MKKVLIITPYFAPFASSFSVRISKITKYLREFGWEPIILTTDTIYPNLLPVELPENSINRTPFYEPVEILRNYIKRSVYAKPQPSGNTEQPSSSIKAYKSQVFRLIYDIYWYIFNFPDKGIWWYLTAVRHGKRIIDSDRPDIILSMAGYFSTHIISSTLSKKYGIPWIASFDDPWDEGYHVKRMAALQKLDYSIRKNTTRKASAILASTEPEVKIIKKQFTQPVFYLPHGFDEEEYKINYLKNNKFIVSHIGLLHNLGRNPDKILSAIINIQNKGLINEINFELRFIGYDSYLLEDTINQMGISNIVKLYKNVPYKESIIKQKESSVLLLLGSSSTFRTCPLKLFEYFGAQKPILYLSPQSTEDTPAAIIAKESAGITVRTQEEVENQLTSWINDFTAGKPLKPFISSEARLNLSWRRSAEILAGILNINVKSNGK